jgi:hypothetical protein
VDVEVEVEVEVEVKVESGVRITWLAGCQRYGTQKQTEGRASGAAGQRGKQPNSHNKTRQKNEQASEQHSLVSLQAAANAKHQVENRPPLQHVLCVDDALAELAIVEKFGYVVIAPLIRAAHGI